MAAVTPPDITYRPHLAPVISEGLLSDIQLERVIYAGQRHEQRLPDGARGFFVGDGTGVGKGRVLAGMLPTTGIKTANVRSGSQSIMICSNQRGAI